VPVPGRERQKKKRLSHYQLSSVRSWFLNILVSVEINGKKQTMLAIIDRDSQWSYILKKMALEMGCQPSSLRGLYTPYWRGLSKRMECVCYDLPIDRCPRSSIFVFDNQQITFNWNWLTLAVSALNDTFCSLLTLHKSTRQYLKSIIGTLNPFSLTNLDFAMIFWPDQHCL